MLARLYVANEQYNDAIPVLAEIVKQEPGWLDGASLLVQAYVAADRTPDAIRWLEEVGRINPQLYPTLGDLYARGRRWADASAAYESAHEGDAAQPRPPPALRGDAARHAGWTTMPSAPATCCAKP